jgi:hypothetical protein
VWETNNITEVGFGALDSIHILGRHIPGPVEEDENAEEDEEDTKNFVSRFYISRKNKVSTIQLNLSELKEREEEYDFAIIIKSGDKVDQFTFQLKNSESCKVERVQDTFKIYPL